MDLLRQIISQARERWRRISLLSKGLVFSGALGLGLPFVLFLLRGDEFSPDAAKEHVGEALRKVRRVKESYQQIENTLEDAGSKTERPLESLSEEERQAVLQVTGQRRSKWNVILDPGFLFSVAACSFFFLLGLYIERTQLAPRRTRRTEAVPGAPPATSP